jgi:hypothetical protein
MIVVSKQKGYIEQKERKKERIRKQTNKEDCMAASYR